MLSDVFSYLTDGANWSGPTGIGTFMVRTAPPDVHVFWSWRWRSACRWRCTPRSSPPGPLPRGQRLQRRPRGPRVRGALGAVTGAVGSEQFRPLGRAGLATLISLVLFALPPLITNAYVGITEVDRDIIEASRGMGMGEGKVFSSGEIPLAMPVIMTGVRLALVQVWATATIAALVAGPGLGRIITRGFANQDTAVVVAGALLVAVGALVLEGAAVLAERFADPMRRAQGQPGQRSARDELLPDAVV